MSDETRARLRHAHSAAVALLEAMQLAVTACITRMDAVPQMVLDIKAQAEQWSGPSFRKARDLFHEAAHWNALAGRIWLKGKVLGQADCSHDVPWLCATGACVEALDAERPERALFLHLGNVAWELIRRELDAELERALRPTFGTGAEAHR